MFLLFQIVVWLELRQELLIMQVLKFGMKNHIVVNVISGH